MDGSWIMKNMKKSELINKAFSVGTDDEKTLFVSTFAHNPDEEEIVAILSAWLSNGTRGELYAIDHLVNDIMQKKPKEYLENYYGEAPSEKFVLSQSFFRQTTHYHLARLLEKIRKIQLSQKPELQDTFEYLMSRPKNKCTFIHDAFAEMFGGETMFPTRESNGTFYRFNLLYYWLTYKLKIWHLNPYKDAALLPCNDKIFTGAYELGVVSKRMTSNLKSTIALTEIAREWFGDKDFYKMYELLNFYND